MRVAAKVDIEKMDYFKPIRAMLASLCFFYKHNEYKHIPILIFDEKLSS